jgi:hypothetical protein
MEFARRKKSVQDTIGSFVPVLFCSRAASAAIVGDVLMARNTIRQLTQLLPAVAVVATAFATSQPVTGLIDPGTSNDAVRDQLSITRLTDTPAPESRAPSIAHLQIRGTQGPRPCSGFFVTAHLLMTARHCVMTELEAANASLDLDAGTIRGLQLLISQDDLDFSLLWVDAGVPALEPTPGTPTSVIRTRLLDRLTLLEQAKPAAATELRAALQ